MTFVPWSKISKEKSTSIENAEATKRTSSFFSKTIWIMCLALGFIMIQSLILGLWFTTYTKLKEERIEFQKLEARLAKTQNYEALIGYDEDADKRLFEVTAKAEGKYYQLFSYLIRLKDIRGQAPNSEGGSDFEGV